MIGAVGWRHTRKHEVTGPWAEGHKVEAIYWITCSSILVDRPGLFAGGCGCTARALRTEEEVRQTEHQGFTSTHGMSSCCPSPVFRSVTVGSAVGLCSLQLFWPMIGATMCTLGISEGMGSATTNQAVCSPVPRFVCCWARECCPLCASQCSLSQEPLWQAVHGGGAYGRGGKYTQRFPAFPNLWCHFGHMGQHKGSGENKRGQCLPCVHPCMHPPRVPCLPLCALPVCPLIWRGFCNNMPVCMEETFFGAACLLRKPGLKQ